MEPHNFIEEEICNVCYIITLVASNEVCHFRELINYHRNSNFPSRSPWEDHNEVYANIISNALRDLEEECKGLSGSDFWPYNR